MKTRDWLLGELIRVHTQLAAKQADYLQVSLNAANEEVAALRERVKELAPAKQFIIKESSLAGDSAIRTIQSVYSSKGVTTITL
jgi:hypothetical protein